MQPIAPLGPGGIQPIAPLGPGGIQPMQPLGPGGMQPINPLYNQGIYNRYLLIKFLIILIITLDIYNGLCCAMIFRRTRNVPI